MPIPVVDLFAGPGGLGEGFCSLLNNNNQRVFKIVLSVEKDFYAHQTLTLRSFFRQFEPGLIPDAYYEFLKGIIKIDELYKLFPEQAELAKKEALHATLGENGDSITNNALDKIIVESLHGEHNWLLIGGPPCQAYSIVGRSRRQEKVLDEKKDERVGLYKHYLRILAVHSPAVFVMENVKGLLSARTQKSSVLRKILHDLNNPTEAYYEDFASNGININCPGYKIYSVKVLPASFEIEGKPVFNQKDFVIPTEKYGIPQTRHRLIMLGVRNDIDLMPAVLQPLKQIPLSKVLSGLPQLRAGLSKVVDSGENWRSIITTITKGGKLNGIDREVRAEILKQIDKIHIPRKGTGDDYILYHQLKCKYKPEWFLDPRIEGICNHSSRGHMESDLLRYFFASCFAKIKKCSPKLADFPAALLPEHKNVNDGISDNKFGDRFRVQVWNQPSKTITSHISKDGHYYIHPDPAQCRSLTVREAARLQTFPDNYYFCGPRTEQFIQVGNAVPPFLANQIAVIVKNILQG